MLANGQIDLRKRTLLGHLDVIPNETTAPLNDPKITFDPATNRLLQTYDWGTIACDYRIDGTRLFMTITVNNTAKESIRTIDMAVLRLKLPGWTKKDAWEKRWPQTVNETDDPQILEVNYDSGTLLFCGEDVDRPTGLHILPEKKSDEYALVLRYHSLPLMGNPIGKDDSHQFNVSVRFGPKGAARTELAKDIYARFAERFPFQVKWNDRRPIGQINLSSSAMGIKKNPRGWFMDRTNLDVTTEAGVNEFHQRLLKHADTCIGFAKQMNAQGVIIWDIEGQEMPHMISYIGDPRMMDQMAPEMSGVADAFMQKFRDAGLRVGVTVRPSHVVPNPGGKERWQHIQPADPVDEIAQKIEYAKKRWGCTLFYIDSTTLWINDSSGNLELKTMPAEFFHILADCFPDCLLIPEQSTARHWAYCACYHELQQGYTSTKPDVRAIYPNSFSVLRVVDAGLDVVAKNHDALVAGVRSGDILLFRTWFDDPYDAEIKKIYKEAGQEQK